MFGWGRLVVCALAQTFAKLSDEFEHPGPEFLSAADYLLRGAGEGNIQHSIVKAVLLQSCRQPGHLSIGEPHTYDRPFASLCLVHGHPGNHALLAHTAGQGGSIP